MTESRNLHLHDLTAELEQAINDLSVSGDLEQTGIVTKVADGVVSIYGLAGAGLAEVIEIETADGKVPAFVLNLTSDEVGAVLMGSEHHVAAGAKVTATGKTLEVPVGPELVGRVVDPLGRPLDDAGPLKAKLTAPVERPAIGVMGRKSVHEPLATGLIAIDTMVPIGRGQRQLIIGDRGTGKTAITLDTMINQAKQKTGVINVYVAIGQKLSKIASLVERLKAEGVMEQTIVVATSPADPASLLYLAPYAATSMGEYFRDKGEHALMIYDDLSKHAVAYRQMSLLLRRPPGREAYPGDVFYLHSRLLERSAKLSDELGAGSLTALPIIETQAGDIGAYIPTNVISITDGQIFLETGLFYQGVRPAISVGLSVSRVGGAAQTKATKSVAGTLRLDLAQFRELAAFSQFSSDLDEATRQRLNRGRVLTDLLKQRQYHPQSIADQVSVMTAANAGVFDATPAKRIAEAAELLRTEFATKHEKLAAQLNMGTKPEADDTKKIIDLAKIVAKTFADKE